MKMFEKNLKIGKWVLCQRSKIIDRTESSAICDPILLPFWIIKSQKWPHICDASLAAQFANQSSNPKTLKNYLFGKFLAIVEKHAPQKLVHLITKHLFDDCKRLQHEKIFDNEEIAPQMKILIKWGSKFLKMITEFIFWSQGRRKNLDFYDHETKVCP